MTGWLRTVLIYYTTKCVFCKYYSRIYTDTANIFKIGKNSAETLPPRCFLVILVVLFSNLEICLGMLAYGANLGCSSTDNHVSAVTALPNGYTALLEYCLLLYVVQKCAVSLLVSLLFLLKKYHKKRADNHQTKTCQSLL